MRPAPVLAMALSSLLALTACAADETVARYGGAGKVWALQDIDGAPFTARATLVFGARGEVSGQAPCNSYSTQQSLPYPWFKVETVRATKMACPDLKSETQFFAALDDMSLSEVAGQTLLLSNDAGRTMTFKAE